VIALPPSDDGADHDSVTWEFPGVAVLRVGAPGVVPGVAESAFEAGPLPATFAATTVNEYEMPLVRPVMAHAVAPPVLQVAPPGLAVAV
jgi:hypothetical protein